MSDIEAFEQLGLRQHSLYPEPRTASLSTKVTRSTNKAVMQALEAKPQTKAAFVESIIEGWLKANGYLK